jgi:hypothetical protein
MASCTSEFGQSWGRLVNLPSYPTQNHINPSQQAPQPNQEFDPDYETSCAPSFAASSHQRTTNKTLRRYLSEINSGQMSRMLKRLGTYGLIQKSDTRTSTT